MTAQSQKQLSWQERPTRELVRLAWPITVSMLSFSTMSIVDALLVGHLGASALAGVGLGSISVFVLVCFPFGLLRAAKTLASQAIGAGRTDELASYRGAALVTALGFGVVAIALGSLAAPFLGRLSEDAASGEAAAIYLSIRVFGAPLVLAYRALRETLYAEGDTRTPMLATVAANVVNAALAAFFVFGLGLGVAGAASATVIAHAVEAGTLVAVQIRRGAAVPIPGAIHLRKLWTLGVPSGGQFVLEVGSFFLLTLILQRLSHVEAAAHQMALQVNHLAFLPAFAISEAAAVLVGQAVGAGRDDLIRGLARRALAAASIYTGFCAVVLLTFASSIVSLFVSSSDASGPALAAAATPLLWIQGVFIVFDGVNIVARGVLGGTGDVRFPAVVGVVTSWAMTPPLAWFLGVRLGLGAAGGWLGLCGEILLSSAILYRRVETGGWMAAAAASRAALAQAPARVANEDVEAAPVADAPKAEGAA